MSESKSSGVWDDAAKGRARAAFLAAFVADAAAMPLHWIYDAAKLGGLIDEHGLFFVEPAHTPFYKHPAGTLSPYGAELLALSKSIEKRNGVDTEHLPADVVGFMSTYAGYKNHSTRNLIAAVDEGKTFPECGSDDSQNNCIVKVPALVARYGGTAELRTKVEQAVRVQQNNDRAVSNAITAASVLERVVFGATVQEAIKAVIADESIDSESRSRLQAVVDASGVGHSEFVAKNGLGCNDPGGFLGSFHNAYTATSVKGAVEAEIRAAGDQCGRLVFPVAVTAAAAGASAIPEEWTAKTANFTEYAAMVDAIIAQRA